MSFAIVFSRSGVDASNLLDEERLWWRFFCTAPTPRALEEFESEHADNAAKVEMATHPSRQCCVHFLRCIVEDLSLFGLLEVL